MNGSLSVWLTHSLCAQRKTRTHVVEGPTNEKDDTPKSFVFKMGKAPGVVSDLVTDFRRVMAPYTADKLREKRCVLLAICADLYRLGD